MIRYKEKPFYLTDEDIAWVEETLESMTLDEKIGQLFCLTDMITDPAALHELVERYHPGGFMYRAGDAREIQSAHRVMQSASRIPLLLGCNLESGGNGVDERHVFWPPDGDRRHRRPRAGAAAGLCVRARGRGDPKPMHNYIGDTAELFHGRALAILKKRTPTGTAHLTLQSDSMEIAETIAW